MTSVTRTRSKAGGKPQAIHRVVAAFPSLTSAENALDALEWAGIEAAEISVHGRAADLRSQDGDQADGRDREVALSRYIALRTVKAAVAGTAIGVIAGLILGLIAAGLADGTAAGTVLGIAIIGGGVFGLTVGGLVGGESGLNINAGWEAGFDTHADGAASVAVRSVDIRDVDRAEVLLRRRDALHVSRLRPS